MRSNQSVTRGRRSVHISDMLNMSSRVTYGVSAISASENVSPASQGLCCRLLSIFPRKLS